MKTLPKKSQWAFVWALVKNYSRTVSKRRAARIAWAALAGQSEIPMDEKVKAVIRAIVRQAGNWELAFMELRTLPCFVPSELDKLRAWIRGKKGGAL